MLILHQHIIKIFHHDQRNYRLEDVASKVVVDSIFGKHSFCYLNLLLLEVEKGFLSFWRFVLHLKKELIYINSLLKFYFGHKFLKGSIHFKLPKLSKPSYLINKELLILLYLSNAFVQTSQKMLFLYSSTADYFKFSDLIETLTSNLLFLILFPTLHSLYRA